LDRSGKKVIIVQILILLLVDGCQHSQRSFVCIDSSLIIRYDHYSNIGLGVIYFIDEVNDMDKEAIKNRIIEVLEEADTVLSAYVIEGRISFLIDEQHLWDIFQELVKEKKILMSDAGYRLLGVENIE